MTSDLFRFGPDFALLDVTRFFRSRESLISLLNIGPVVLRPADSDMAVIRQIYGTREYDISSFPQYPRIQKRYSDLLHDRKLPLIIDAGANIGASTRFFSTEYPDALVLAIEPDPENARLCRINTASQTNTRTLQAALGGTPGRVTLAPPDDRSWSIRTERSSDGHVPVVTIPQLVAAEGIDAQLFLVKIDIEGFESDVFEDAGQWIEQPSAIIVEIHDWLFPGQLTSQSLLHAMSGVACDIMIHGENLVFIRQS
jgi:FkbM family methyltransferase